MVPQFSFWLLLVAIIHCPVFPTTVNAELAFVQPNASVSCASPHQRPCLTFNEFAEQVDQYFVDNTTFLFLPGTHELNVPLDLKDLSNISLVPLSEGINESDAVQLFIDPSVNVTWDSCKNIKINGFIFILSGQFNVLSDTAILSAELVFHNTSAVLASLTLTGNGTRLFALMNVSSDVWISYLMADGIRAPILLAYDSTITFHGHNTFCNNNITVNVFTITGLIQLDRKSSCYIHEKILFMQNNLYLELNPDALLDFIPGGTAVSVIDSILVISGMASFVRNQVRASLRQNLYKIKVITNGGALFARNQSIIIFEESSNISFVDNSAELGGGAISILDSILTMYGKVLFEGNSADKGGAIYAQAYFYNAHFELRNVWFERNTALLSGGAIYADSTFIKMTGVLDFVKNSAQMGGAIAIRSFSRTHISGELIQVLISSSKLRLVEPLMANFVNNSATVKGGVIFLDENICVSQLCDKSPGVFSYCFIEFSSKDNIRLNFDNNSAEIAGRIIFYGGDLDTCIPYISGRHDFSQQALNVIASISNLNVNIGNYKENATSNVSSDPVQVCICKGDGVVCNYTETEMVIPGEELILQAVIVGQGFGAISSAVRVYLENGIQVSLNQNIQPTGKACTNITYRLFSETNTTVLTLFPENGICRASGIGKTRVRVEFLPCPNGFVLTDSKCVCKDRLQHLHALCNVEDETICWTSISDHFWMGALYKNDSNKSTYEGLILYFECPFDFCVDRPVPITLDNLDIQCNHNHSGILCGSCKKDYSIVLGNLHCLPCSDDYLALILLFALIGIALVVFILLLGLTVTAGTINGLIFYTNVIHVHQYVFFPVGTRQLLAWFNLDIGFQICFYDGMTIYAYTWLQFVFPFYVWFLIGLIITTTHYSRKLTKLLGKNPVAALATLLLLSYSKILRAIFAALASTTLHYPSGESKLVWSFDGNVAYGSGSHFVLALFAVLILVFLFIPYTLLLFFAHWLQALSHRRIFSWLNKIKPFIDTYHAPYKKQTRYWTGLLLFVRLSLFAIHAINSELTPIVITSITAALLSMAWMHKSIYESRLNDLFEAFFLVNLCILLQLLTGILPVLDKLKLVIFSSELL